MPNSKNAGHPIFDFYDTTELWRITGYQEETLLDIKRGRKPASRRFRDHCLVKLNERPENNYAELDLFNPEPEPIPTPA